ncbi:hypothetical protein MAPG_08736 [Magnaporthiopsis poae ATCC 64411]|uniref:Uncharacterized protein n=1 Tax=Magnaporthiopsis poae (strain ATCC 64411 / 73-15) TaxID=644358 RepID=A0A0C4E848_MAGP6|nr:hypothetical protein MAPG_08736 [Magnaporthiopsis poae ATCC 64411]
MSQAFQVGDLVGATIDDPDGSGAKIEIQGIVSKNEDYRDARRIAVRIAKFRPRPSSGTDDSQNTPMEPWTSESNPVWIRKEDLWRVPKMPWQDGTYADEGYGEGDNPGGEIMESIETD